MNMRSSRDLYPVVLIMGAMLIIALVLAMVYLLGRMSDAEDAVMPPPDPTPVGLEADPDTSGWRPLFNGQTLDGWEITNFGPQGPVLVRDSSIILNYGDGCTGVTWKREFPGHQL
jgi:hypothetical protein